jgi:mono/diheme cytochrome c family protein
MKSNQASLVFPRRKGCSVVGSYQDAWRLTWMLMIVALPGCRSEMYDQARYEPLERSEFFDDGASSRPLVTGTVPRTDPRGMPRVRDVSVFLTGKENGRLAETPPFPVDRRVLEVGQERYRIFCTPCHGELGDGQGIIVKRGFTAPPSFASAELRAEPLGHFFDVITHGHGVMYSYASRVPPQDRWSIAAYIRALQLSQHAVASKLPAEEQSKIKGIAP